MLRRTKTPGQLRLLGTAWFITSVWGWDCRWPLRNAKWWIRISPLGTISMKPGNHQWKLQMFPTAPNSGKKSCSYWGMRQRTCASEVTISFNHAVSPVSWAAVFPVFFLCLGIKENMIYWEIGSKNKNTISPSFPLHSPASVCTCLFGACCNLGALMLGLPVSVCSSKDITHLTPTSLQCLIPVPIVSLRSGADTPLKLEKFLILPCFPFMFSFLAF